MKHANWTRLILSGFCLLAGCARPAETVPAPTAEPIESPAVETVAVTASVKGVNSWPENEKTFTQYELTIQDDETDIQNWKAVLSVPDGTELQQNWNTEIEKADGTWILTPEDYNRTISAGEPLKDVGWIASCDTNETITLLSLELNGEEVSFQKEQKSTPAPAGAEPSPAAVEPIGSLHVANGKLCNEAGEPVQLRGVSTHGLAWFPEYVNRDAFLTLRDDWNANTIRLALYTAESGGYCTGGNQQELLDLIDKGVTYAEELGMYVIIDWHILSDKNPSMHQGEAVAFFTEVSKKYKDKTHVLYEICNEPQESPFLSVIKPYAEDIVQVIRRNDKDAVILVGTNTWCQDIDEVIGNELSDDNVMYTVHFYAGTHKDALRNKLRKALDANVPVYISECSIVEASGNGAADYESAEEWLKLINEYGLSYNAWSLCNKNETSALLKPSCDKLSGWSEADLSETGIWFRNAFRKS